MIVIEKAKSYESIRFANIVSNHSIGSECEKMVHSVFNTNNLDISKAIHIKYDNISSGEGEYLC